MTCAAPPDMMIDTTAATPLRRIIRETTANAEEEDPLLYRLELLTTIATEARTLNTEEARGGRSNSQCSLFILLMPHPTPQELPRLSN